MKSPDIENRIFTIRGIQVMFDFHLAELYGVETKRLNEQVKRNIARFPEEFMFRLSEEEYNSLRSQNATIDQTEFLRSQNATSSDTITNLRFQNGTSSSAHGGRRYLPYVFTEQGVAMLSAVLRSETAVKVSVQIMQAFVSMRKYLTENAGLFQRLDNVERKQIETDEKFEQVFDALQSKELNPRQGIFYDGQVFDAYKFIANLVRKAHSSIILIDNYIDDTVLTLFNKRKKGVQLSIYTKTINKQLELDIRKHNTQYEPVSVKEINQVHDRFLIIDETELYHIGASLKDLGTKWFAFSKMDTETINILKKIKEPK